MVLERGTVGAETRAVGEEEEGERRTEDSQERGKSPCLISVTIDPPP